VQFNRVESDKLKVEGESEKCLNDHSRFYLAWTQVFDIIGHFGYGIGKLNTVTCTNPGQFQSLIFKTKLGKDLLQELDSPAGLEISVNIVAVTGVAPTDQNSISSFQERFDDIFWVHHSCAHDPNQSHIGRVYQSRSSGQIRGCVCTPVTDKRDDGGFKVGHGCSFRNLAI
jgi:hypothetical protein